MPDVDGLAKCKEVHERAAAAFRKGLDKFIHLDTARTSLTMAGLDQMGVVATIDELAKAQKDECDRLCDEARSAREAYAAAADGVREALRVLSFEAERLMPETVQAELISADIRGLWAHRNMMHDDTQPASMVVAGDDALSRAGQCAEIGWPEAEAEADHAESAFKKKKEGLGF